MHTKTELLLEALEEMMVAVMLAVRADPSCVTAREGKPFDRVLAARAEAKKALHDFLQPKLRVVSKLEPPIVNDKYMKALEAQRKKASEAKDES